MANVSCKGTAVVAVRLGEGSAVRGEVGAVPEAFKMAGEGVERVRELRLRDMASARASPVCRGRDSLGWIVCLGAARQSTGLVSTSMKGGE